MLAMDWNSLMIQYTAKFGADLCEEDLPAQSYFEEFEERLAGGRISKLSVSAEWCPKKKLICNVAVSQTQQGSTACIWMDGRLTLQTRRRFTSTEPRNIEQLRAKFSVMENLWLLA